jgi:hypothetical protein
VRRGEDKFGVENHIVGNTDVVWQKDQKLWSPLVPIRPAYRYLAEHQSLACSVYWHLSILELHLGHKGDTLLVADVEKYLRREKLSLWASWR